jgi:MerR family transcriptional regulator, light-induced transcriptional regulator
MLRLGTLEDAQATGQGAGGASFPPAAAVQAPGRAALERPHALPCVAVEQLCAALVAGSPERAFAYVDRLLADGVGTEAIYESLIPRAAARLGERWVEDTLPFTAVTLGMARLTEVFRRLGPGFMRGRKPIRRGRRGLFALVPGEHHALGVVMAADYFQRAGWAVQVELEAGRDDLVGMARSQPFALVGLSAGSRRMLGPLEDLLGRLRAVTRPETRFVIGGALATLEPGLGARLGVGLAGGSPREALHRLECVA